MDQLSIVIQQNSSFGSLTWASWRYCCKDPCLVWHPGSDQPSDAKDLTPYTSITLCKTERFQHLLGESRGHNRSGQSLPKSLLEFRIYGSNKASITLPKLQETEFPEILWRISFQILSHQSWVWLFDMRQSRKSNYYYKNDCNSFFTWGMVRTMSMRAELWVTEVC